MTKLFLVCPLAFAWHDHTGRIAAEDCLLAIVFLLTLAGGFWLARNFWMRRSGTWGVNHPQKLFVALCHAHKLDGNQQRLLSLLAQYHQLPHPGALFLKPDLFDPAKLGPQFAAHVAQIQSLRQRLFGSIVSPANFAQSTQSKA